MNAIRGNTTASPAVVCEQLTHSYTDAEGGAVHALRGVDLVVDHGEAVALLGPSGAGKSTLLTILAGLTRPTGGRVRVAGTEITGLAERDLTRLRARRIGMVLQTPGRNVLPYATARQNVAFGQRSDARHRSARRAEADDLLAAVGLDEHRDRLARLLSGGQQQRLALAVALAGGPAVLLADEPTSQLDQHTGDDIVQVLLDVRERYDSALVVVTHDPHVSDALDTAYVLHDGDLVRGGRQR